MRVYLGPGVLQSTVTDFFAQERAVGAICHGVLLAARSSLCPQDRIALVPKLVAAMSMQATVGMRARLAHRPRW
jgi:putative intracellular protease/amidase